MAGNALVRVVFIRGILQLDQMDPKIDLLLVFHEDVIFSDGGDAQMKIAVRGDAAIEIAGLGGNFTGL